MNWIDIKDFKFDRTGDVLLVMNNAKNKEELVVRNDRLYHTIYEKAPWIDISVKSGDKMAFEVDDTHVEFWGFTRASFKNVKAIMFTEDLLNEYLTNTK